MLLERVAELLAAAALGAPPFCVQLPPQIQGGPYGSIIRAHATSSGLQGLFSANASVGTGRQVAPAPSSASEGVHAAAFGFGRPPRHHPQDDAPSRTAWHAGRYGKVHEAVDPEAYVPRMVDQGCVLEEDHGSSLGPGWGEEAPEAELFQEPQESLDNRTDGSNYRVPLIPQEQAYANHRSQEVQVTTVDGGPSSAASHPPGGAH